MTVRPLCAIALATAWCGALGAFVAPAGAIELWDGRIEVHGFYETRLSFGMQDFDPSQGVDMYSFLHVLDVEVESELAPDGWGPFDMVSAFSRIEVKYDCVWNHACGLFENVNTFGNHPRQMPDRVQNSRRQGIAASQETFDRRPYWFGEHQRLTPGLFSDVRAGARRARPIEYGYVAVGLFGASPGPNQMLGDIRDVRDGDPLSGLPGDDDGGLYLFDRTNHCKSGTWSRKDSSLRGYQTRELPWSIDGCDIEPLRWTQNVANPFRDRATYGDDGDVNPVLVAIGEPPGGIPIATALPLRPGSENPAGRHRNGKPWESQGLFVPNYRLRNEIRRGSFGSYDQNFSLNELQWNRGASQQQTKELREFYFDLELFESRLWLRAGKQTIVWGKTEIFRNQDQWNPVDIAIGPLAALEEARIALWALRGVWSFYEVGPFQDVRAELVVLYDQFEPTDVGRCGEPYVPRVACDKTFGLWVHGQESQGIAGEIRPEDPWSSAQGIEVGGRLEFRWERFSFALSDYWGYNDSPYGSMLFQYDRNVDPLTGQPRHTNATGRCETGAEAPCLARFAPGAPGGNDLDGTSRSVVEVHSIDQSIFAWVCSGTVGVAPSVDPAACAFTLFNSKRPFPLGGTFASAFSAVLSGNAAGAGAYAAIIGDFPPPAKIENVLLAEFGPAGTNTLDPTSNAAFPGSPLVTLLGGGPLASLDVRLSTEQQAFLGCGEFYLTSCIVEGIDLANSAADVILQSFPWFEGTFFNPNWDTTDASLPQPGTFDALIQGYGADIPAKPKRHGGFKPGDVTTGAVGTRYEDDNGVDDDGDGRKKDLIILPGARIDACAFQAVVLGLSGPCNTTLTDPTLNGATISPYILRHYNQYLEAVNTADPNLDNPIDGQVCGRVGGTVNTANCRIHPFTGQVFSSEMAILSWNLLMLATGLGATENPSGGVVPNLGTLDQNNPLALGRCSYRQPQYCTFVSGFASQARNTSSSVRAGGNGRFGRRNFVWASVGDVALRYQKRNILGFSTDFAEDRTKSSWGVEFTWVNDSFTGDGSNYDGISEVDEYNLTLSVDRPTFINFLNPNRTFLLNTQLFTSYIGGYDKAMPREGPWTFLWLVNISTGYFQDRFLPSAIVVFDLRSQSAAFLPSVQYRLTENFSITVGASVFGGRFSSRKMGINQFSAFDEDNLRDTIYVENGISPVRDLDGFYARLRYTF